MPRPTTKLTADQQKLLEAAITAAQKSDEAARQAKAIEEAAWDAIITARNAGVPDDLLCKQTGFSRATLNRKFGKRPEVD
ncbi:hypothetical protein [Winogradskya consettensis]|uniref:hypothetical protein n=1 Tax=Winogradskya consettensis TaxID=113560 RepID=UPI001BB425FB|nr:hypothetical protein [Actinoplanes consettensis]